VARNHDVHAGRRGHVEPSGDRSERQLDVALIGVERVGDRAEAQEGHLPDSRPGRRSDREMTVVLDDRGRGGDRRTRAFEQIGRREDLGAREVGAEASAPRNQARARREGARRSSGRAWAPSWPPASSTSRSWATRVPPS
jgi:hypothetical protein